jgi:hypothetical protein
MRAWSLQRVVSSSLAVFHKQATVAAGRPIEQAGSLRAVGRRCQPRRPASRQPGRARGSTSSPQSGSIPGPVTNKQLSAAARQNKQHGEIPTFCHKPSSHRAPAPTSIMFLVHPRAPCTQAVGNQPSMFRGQGSKPPRDQTSTRHGFTFLCNVLAPALTQSVFIPKLFRQTLNPEHVRSVGVKTAPRKCPPPFS